MTATTSRPRVIDPRTAFIPAAGIEREIRDIIGDHVCAEDDETGLEIPMWGVDEAALAVVEYLREKGVNL